MARMAGLMIVLTVCTAIAFHPCTTWHGTCLGATYTLLPNPQHTAHHAALLEKSNSLLLRLADFSMPIHKARLF